MKRLLPITLIVLAVWCAGCQGDATAKDDAKLRDDFSGKNFDPSKMSPEARAMMEKMNTKGNAPAPAAPTGGK